MKTAMDAPFDRGEIDRSSLDATERLRARLAGRPAVATSPRRSSVLPWIIASGLFVFLAGIIANPWFEANVRGYLPFVGTARSAADGDLPALRDRLARLERPGGVAIAGGGAIAGERLARTEAQLETSSDQIARDADRIDRLTAQVAALDTLLKTDRARSDAASATATAAAERARAMLTLVLVRGAIADGRPLGSLDPALRAAFDARYPAAVKAVSSLGSGPVTLAMLRRDLDTLRPAIGGQPAAGARLNWWDALAGKVSAAMNTAPTSRSPVDAAETALSGGDYRAAAAQLRRFRGARPAALANWLAASDRLQAGMEALTVLETSTLQPPQAAVALPLAAPTPVPAPPPAQPRP